MICSPPLKHSCFFGIDTPDENKLIEENYSIEEIRKKIGADTLGYLSVEGLKKSAGVNCSNLCTACFSGVYPMKVPKTANKFLFDKK